MCLGERLSRGSLFLFLGVSVSNILFIGIKGSGMSNLALILKEKGNFVFGIDKSEYFQPQEKLIESKIQIFDDFNLDIIPHKIDEVIYSTAYENTHCVKQAKLKFKTSSYIDYLAKLTKESKSYGIAGTHGKTTTSGACVFSLSYKERKAFPFFAIFGSSLIDNSNCVFQGDKALIVEACEYQNHFLKYKLDGAIITSIDFDHPDFFNSIDDVIHSFIQFALNIKEKGFLILNTDDKNVKSIKTVIEDKRKDLNIISFGFHDNSLFRVEKDSYSNKYKVRLIGNELFDLKYYDRALINDIMGAALISTCILLDAQDVKLYLNKDDIICDEIFTTLFRTSLKALENFKSVKGRLELKATINNILFLDDYAHHPKEIYTLYNELKNRYPNRKLFAIFTPHTASRTKALYKDFISVFLLFDKLIITKTFASARMDVDNGNLAEKLVKDLNKKLLTSFKIKLASAIYVDENEEVSKIAASMIENDDIVISLGASNNDRLYKEIIEKI